MGGIASSTMARMIAGRYGAGQFSFSPMRIAKNTMSPNDGIAEPPLGDDGGNGDETDRRHRGDPEAGNDGWEGKRHLDPPEQLVAGMSHSSSRFFHVGWDALEAHEDVADQDEQGVADEADLGGEVAPGRQRHQEGKEGEAGDRVQEPRDPGDRCVQPSPPVAHHGEREGDGQADPDGESGQHDVVQGESADLAQVVSDPGPVEEGAVVHATISSVIRSSVRIPRYRCPSVTTTATLVREVAIESRACRSESSPVTYALNLRGVASPTLSTPSSIRSSTQPSSSPSSMTLVQSRPNSRITVRAFSTASFGDTTGPSSTSMSATRISARRFSPRSGPTNASTNSLAGARRISSGEANCSRMPPTFRIAMRSAILMASSMSWVTNTVVFRRLPCSSRYW